MLHGNNLMPQVKAKSWHHIWGTHISLLPLFAPWHWSTLCVCVCVYVCVCVFIFSFFTFKEVQKFIPSYNSGIVTLQLENAAIWRREMMQLVDNRWYGYSCYRGLASPRLHSQYLKTACKTKSLLCHGVCVCLFVYVWEWVASFNWSLLKKLQNKPSSPRRENMRTWLKEHWSQRDYRCRDAAL